ncbi:MAG: hypothetical protein RLP02_17840 [Coleofasciculus sp. C2-GNP5-27]
MESLDQAFLRRINFSVKFPFPDAEARTEIWQHIFPEETPTKNWDMKKQEEAIEIAATQPKSAGAD